MSKLHNQWKLQVEVEVSSLQQKYKIVETMNLVLHFFDAHVT